MLFPSLSLSLSFVSLSHTRTLWWHSCAHPLRHRCVSDIHEHPRRVFAFPFPFFLFCFLLYCLYLLIFWNRHYSVCVFSLTLSLLSLILFITILDLLLFIGNNILVCVCMVFMLLLVRSHVCPIFFIVFFQLDRFISFVSAYPAYSSFIIVPLFERNSLKWFCSALLFVCWFVLVSSRLGSVEKIWLFVGILYECVSVCVYAFVDDVCMNVFV